MTGTPETTDAYPVWVDRRVFVPMEDGTRLALTLYLPDGQGDGPFPAVVESVPYRKDDDCTARDWQTFSYLASRGIAGIRIDIRGTGASEGIIEDEYVAQEQADTLEVLAWAASQEWCTGRLGMWGISWGGFSALQTAMLQPAGLEAIAPMHATHDRFACDVHYTGGSLHAAEQVDWPTSMVSCNAMPPDPDIYGDGWFEEWLRRLDATPQWVPNWLRHQQRDDYWRHGSPCADYASIRCPTLLIGGWRDGYVDGMLAMAEHLTCPTRTVIGPWGHSRPAHGYPGPTLDHYDLLARWFGYHLRGDDNGIMDLPAATIYVQDIGPDTERVSGRWRAEPAWPPADGAVVETSLADLAHGATRWDGPQWVGRHAPAWDRAGLEVAPSAADDEESVCFETAPLDNGIEILGTVEVELAVAADQPFGMVAARLLAAAPDGSTYLIARGNRNLAFPEDLSEPQNPSPGVPVSVRFPLLACSAAVPSGWSLRLAVAGADFPIAWPPGRRFALSIDPFRSRLLIPTVPVRPDAGWLDLPEAQDGPPSPVTELRSETIRSIEHDGLRTVYRRAVGHAEHQPTRSDLTYSNDQEMTVGVDHDDPASTVARSVSEMRLHRPGWEVGAVGSLEIRSDAEAFHVAIDLVATHDGVEVFSRSWNESVPRRWA